jgi:hypothetical protein
MQLMQRTLIRAIGSDAFKYFGIVLASAVVESAILRIPVVGGAYKIFADYVVHLNLLGVEFSDPGGFSGLGKIGWALFIGGSVGAKAFLLLYSLFLPGAVAIVVFLNLMELAFWKVRLLPENDPAFSRLIDIFMTPIAFILLFVFVGYGILALANSLANV